LMARDEMYAKLVKAQTTMGSAASSLEG